MIRLREDYFDKVLLTNLKGDSLHLLIVLGDSEPINNFFWLWRDLSFLTFSIKFRRFQHLWTMNVAWKACSNIKNNEVSTYDCLGIYCNILLSTVIISFAFTCLCQYVNVCSINNPNYVWYFAACLFSKCF